MHKILDVDYTDATELTLDNWLSAAKQMFTILPDMGLSNWTPPDNFQGYDGAGWTSSVTPYYRTKFHNMHGLTLDKMLMLGAPDTLPIPSNIRVVVFSIRGFASGISAIIRTFPSKKYCRSIRQFRSIYNCIF